MKWYHYVAAVFAGAFLANTVPHLVNGVSGNEFPTPFASPPGEGFSSPVVNVLWALGNLVVGYILLLVSKVTSRNIMGLLFILAGFACMSLMLSLHFYDVMKPHFR